MLSPACTSYDEFRDFEERGAAFRALVGEMKGNHDPRLKKAAQWQLDYMARYETYMGGWNYYDFNAGTQSPSMGPTLMGVGTPPIGT